jgi:hypothetical protein
VGNDGKRDDRIILPEIFMEIDCEHVSWVELAENSV